MIFGDIEIKKYKFYHYKSPIFFKGIDIDNISVSNKIYLHKKKL